MKSMYGSRSRLIKALCVIARATGTAKTNERRKAANTRKTEMPMSATNCLWTKRSTAACQICNGDGRKRGSIKGTRVTHHHTRNKKSREERNGQFTLCFFFIILV